jgi:hypothetical protein
VDQRIDGKANNLSRAWTTFADETNRKYLNNFLTKPGPFADEDATFGEELIERLSSMKVL